MERWKLGLLTSLTFEPGDVLIQEGKVPSKVVELEGLGLEVGSLRVPVFSSAVRMSVVQDFPF